MITRAVVTCGHPGSWESLSVMLRAVGVEVYAPDRTLQATLRQAGCDTVLDVPSMARNWGYRNFAAPRLVNSTVFCRMIAAGDTVYVDTKAHRNGPKVVRRWPRAAGRVLWYRINGGEPADVPGKGPELDPGYPVLTPDLWYRSAGPLPQSTVDRSYACWPPFARWGEFSETVRPADAREYDHPACIVHNLDGWGYGEVAERLRREVKLRCHGGYGSPDGLLHHRELPRLLGQAVAYVHLKSVDAPGYALYEAMAAGCPVVIPRRFIERCRADELFEDGVTCLTFDALESEGLEIPVERCVREVEAALERLHDPAENRRVGEAGRERIRGILWSPNRPADVESLRGFLTRVFP